MKKLFLLGLFIIVPSLTVFPQTSTPQPYWSGGLNAGFNSGLGIMGNIRLSNFAEDFPFDIKLAIEYTSVDPGNPNAARSIFINDATNGVPQKSGYIWDFRMDFMHRVNFLGLPKAFLYVGPRYSMFTAVFDFIDGNEFFNINSNQWGLGGGAEADFLLTGRFALVFNAGLDYYFLSEIYGHDTSYDPNGTIINGRKNYTYQSADNAINQPKLVLKLLMGFNYYF
jgi:hypothetical protein